MGRPGARDPSHALHGGAALSQRRSATDHPGHWEIYNFAIGSGTADGLGGEAGFDINYGAAKDLQLTAVLPLAYGDARGFGLAGLHAGLGDVELAVKARFLHQSEGSWTPDVAFFPRVFVPTAGRQFGTGRVGLFLPLWAEKDAGPWSVFGGGGYQLNPGAGQRDFWQGGVALNRSFGPRLSAGVEVYAQTRDTDTGGNYRALDLALAYRLVKHWSVLSSAGPAWDDRSGHGYVFYTALKADY